MNQNNNGGEQPKGKLWTGNFLCAMGVRACSSLVFSLFNVCVAAHVFLSYDCSVGQAGLAVGAFAIASIFSRLFAGKYLDIVGRRRMLVGGALVYFMFTAVFFLPISFELFLCARFVQGIAFGIQSNTITTLTVVFIPGERRAEGLGYFQLASKVSTSLGPFVGLPILHAFGFTSIVLISAIATLGCFLCSVLLNIPPEIGAPCCERRSKSNAMAKKGVWTDKLISWLAGFFEKTALPAAIVGLTVNACHGTTVAFINTFAEELNLANVVQWYFIVYMIVLFATRPATGKFMDKYGAARTLIPLTLFFCAGALLLALTNNLFLLLLSACFVSFGYSGVFLGGQVAALDSSPKDKVSLATSTYYSLADVGMGLGPLVFGSLVPLVGYAGMFVCCAVCLALLATILFCNKAKSFPSRTGE